MKYQNPLVEGTFLKRYKRFFADVQLGCEVVVAHVPNTGSMKGCNEPGSRCLVTHNPDPARKLKYTLEMIQAPTGAWVGVNTSTPNKIVREALETGLLSHWQGFARVVPEFKISAATRFDFMLEREDGSRHFVEVKNVTMADDTRAMFPDAVTERGQKHLRELMELVHAGHTAEVVFTVQRSDVKTFAPAASIDPQYAKLFAEARKAGVKMTPLQVRLGPDGTELTGEILPLDAI